MVPISCKASYTKNLVCYVKHTLCKYLSTTFNIKKNKADNSDFTKFGMKIGTVQDLQELPHWEKYQGHSSPNYDHNFPCHAYAFFL